MSFSSTAAVFSQNAFLNPGPAPAPPERSKLMKSLTSSIDNLNQNPPPPALPQAKRINTNIIHLNTEPTSPGVEFISLPSPSTHSPTSNNTTPNQRDDPKGRFLRHGWTTVKEDGSFKMWNKKYLVLRDCFLDFYKNEVCNLRLAFLLT